MTAIDTTPYFGHECLIGFALAWYRSGYGPCMLGLETCKNVGPLFAALEADGAAPVCHACMVEADALIRLERETMNIHCHYCSRLDRLAGVTLPDNSGTFVWACPEHHYIMPMRCSCGSSEFVQFPGPVSVVGGRLVDRGDVATCIHCGKQPAALLRVGGKANKTFAECSHTSVTRRLEGLVCDNCFAHYDIRRALWLAGRVWKCPRCKGMDFVERPAADALGPRPTCAACGWQHTVKTQEVQA